MSEFSRKQSFLRLQSWSGRLGQKAPRLVADAEALLGVCDYCREVPSSQNPCLLEEICRSVAGAVAAAADWHRQESGRAG